MLSLLLLTAAFSAPDTSVSLHYSGPEAEGEHPVERYSFIERDKGAVVWVGADDANLRTGPAIDAKVVKALPLGTKVTVVERTDRMRVLDRVDRWYRVKLDDGSAGYLFGNVLTSAAWRLDLDMDGDDELVTVTANAGFSFRVRVAENPDASAADERKVTSLDVAAIGGAYVSSRGGSATVRIRREPRVPLVEVDAHQEACAEYGTTWVAYQQPAKGEVRGKLAPALALRGISDPPISSSFEVTFRGDQATVVRRQSEESDREDAKFEVTATHYRRKGLEYLPRE